MLLSALPPQDYSANLYDICRVVDIGDFIPWWCEAMKLLGVYQPITHDLGVYSNSVCTTNMLRTFINNSYEFKIERFSRTMIVTGMK